MNLKDVGKNLDLPWSYETLGSDEGLEIKLVRYYGEYPRHSHDGDQFMLVIEGEVEIEIEGKIHKLSEMDFFHIPAHKTHRPIARKSSLVLVIWRKGIKTSTE